jgi:hypothetical protein
MKVNFSKTQMLVVSDAVSFEPSAYLVTPDGEEIQSSEEQIKLLGFVFDGSPTAKAQVEALVKKVRRSFGS